MATATGLFETIHAHNSRPAAILVADAAIKGARIGIRKVLRLMSNVIESNPCPAPKWPAVKGRVCGCKVNKRVLMTRRTLLVRHRGQVKVGAMMFSMARRAGDLAVGRIGARCRDVESLLSFQRQRRQLSPRHPVSGHGVVWWKALVVTFQAQL